MGIMRCDVRLGGMAKQPFDGERVGFRVMEAGGEGVAAPVGGGVGCANPLSERAEIVPVLRWGYGLPAVSADNGIAAFAYPCHQIRVNLWMHRDNAILSRVCF